MAAKRFVKSSIDWAAFIERVPVSEKAKFQQFKSKVDGYAKRVMSNPEKPPAIDFEAYRSRLPNRAMVDEFEKQYKGLKVPFPVDKLTSQVDEQEKKLDVFLQQYRELADLQCKYYEKVLIWWKEMIPLDQMTMDDYADYFPDSPHNVYKYPSFWPHDEPPRPVFPYLEKKAH